GETGALVADRVLGNLHQNLVARLQGKLDTTGLLALALTRSVLRRSLPVDFPRVQHGVAATPDVHERGLQAGQYVLHAAEVDVADQRRLLRLGDIVLDEHLVFEHADLDAVLLLAQHHDTVDTLAAGQELSLGDHRTATPGIATIAATLLLRLQPGRTANLLRLVARLRVLARLAHLDDGVGRGALVALVLFTGATTGPTTHGRALVIGRVVVPSGARRNHGGEVWRLEQERGRRPGSSFGSLRSRLLLLPFTSLPGRLVGRLLAAAGRRLDGF